ncbi:MAG: acetyl-CoA carboxylase, biotin carboxyl carrier protein, partial [Xanthobacteraceae bacterium]
MASPPDDSSAAKSASLSDGALIRELATLLDETNLTEIEIERAGLRVRVARSVSIAAVAPVAPVAAVV